MEMELMACEFGIMAKEARLEVGGVGAGIWMMMNWRSDLTAVICLSSRP